MRCMDVIGPRAFTRLGMTASCRLLRSVCCPLCAFAFDFPPLTGRVVDQANVMTPESRSDIEAKLKDLEDKSGIQLVVATVKSLQGGDIETYANELFRFWKLGQAQKNNGVLLLVAPAEHKVRIEVGYGLEGTLTDALSSVIISSAIIPRFKTGDFSGGIERGVDGIISVLSGDTADWQPKVDVRARRRLGAISTSCFRFCFSCCMLFICWYLIRNANGTSSGGGARARRRPDLRALRRFVEFWRRRRVSAAAALVAAFPAAAVRPAAAAHRGAGDAFHQGGSRGGLGRDPRGGEANLRPTRLRAGAFVVELCAYSDFVGERAGADRAVAADLFHAMERAADFPAAACRFHRRRLGLLLDAAAARARSAAVQRARAHRAALEQFVVRGISRTKNRTGVLIFVSLAEHYARIIADEGIAAKVHNAEWQAAIDALTAHMRDGRIAAGFTAAIERCGAVLAAHAPPDGSANELPDRLYVM